MFCANVIYGANYTIAKLIMPEYIRPYGFIFIRVTVSTLLFVACWRLFKAQSIHKTDWPRILLCAITGVAVNQLLFFKGLSLTSPVNAGLMMVTNPVFVLLLGFIFLNEAVTVKKSVGILLALSGAVLLILSGKHAAVKDASPAGDAMILANSFSYSVYLILIKPLMHKYHPLTLMAVIFSIGSVLVFPFGWEEFRAIQWQQFDLRLWSVLAFVVIGTTFFAYLFNTIGLQGLSPSVVSVYIYLQPLLAVFFALLLSKGTFTVLHLLTAVLIFTGVYLTTSSATTRRSTS